MQRIRTAEHLCTMQPIEGRDFVVTLLLDKGADVNAKDGRDWTPLAYAINFRKPDVQAVLIKHGGTR